MSDPEQPLPSGWLPPRPPGEQPLAPERPSGPERPTFVTQQRPAGAPNTPATVSVVVGSIALALLVLSLGLWFVVTVPGSVVALVLARAARRRIEAGLTSAGAGSARAGQVLAVIGIVAGIVAAIVWIILFASGFSLEELVDDLQQELDRQQDGGGSSDAIEV